MNQDIKSLTDIVKEIVPEFGKGVPLSEGSMRRYAMWLDEGRLEKELAYRNHSASASELLDFFIEDYNTLGKTGTVQEKRKFFGHTVFALAIYDAIKRLLKGKPDMLEIFNAVAPRIGADCESQTDKRDIPDELLFEPVKYIMRKGIKGRPAFLSAKLAELATYLKGVCDNSIKLATSALDKRSSELNERFAQYHAQHFSGTTTPLEETPSKVINSNLWDAYNVIAPLIMALADNSEAK